MPHAAFWLMLALPLGGLGQSPDSAPSQQAPIQSEFHVRYVSGDSIYIDGGRDKGLSEGTKLILRQNPRSVAVQENVIAPGVLARLTVVAIAATSAVCQVSASTRDIAVGDTLSLPDEEIEKLVAKITLGNTRTYPMVISFSLGDPLDEELREAIPHPPLPEINQTRARIGFDVSTIRGLGANNWTSTTLGVVLRANVTRIGATHWNLDGYWRGRIQSTSAPAPSSIQDLINRTYQMALTYVNPQSNWTAGMGRLYLPWASSLEVIDGGYVGRRLSSTATLGVFAGSTPDPTAWNYDPRRKIGGGFLNIEGVSFEEWRYASTIGGGVALLDWSVDRPFVFTQNEVSYKHAFSLYHAMQIDRPAANPGTAAVGAGVGQSFLSIRVQPD